ncbi:MAG: carboxypeptidase regulatory-like domain-containing protein [Myxococcota bacterium]|nr:carboxypeptidase regulatory-like domain-containing protein [Myxococcota bacterium]
MSKFRQRPALVISVIGTVTLLAIGIWLLTSFLAHFSSVPNDGYLGTTKTTTISETAPPLRLANQKEETRLKREQSESGSPFSNIRVSGRVYDAATSRGIANAIVTIKVLDNAIFPGADQDARKLTVETDSAGYYDAKGIPPGLFEFRAEATGYFPNTVQIRKYDVIENDEGIDLALRESIVVEGLVQNEAMQPVENAKIIASSTIEKRYITAADPNARSDRLGRFIIDPVSKQTRQLFAFHPDYEPTLVSIPAGKSAVKSMKITLKKGHELFGKVIGNSGPLVNATVGFEFLSTEKQSLYVQGMEDQLSTKTNTLGEYQIHASTKKTQGLFAVAEGYQKQRKRIKFSQAKEQIDFNLKPAKTASGQVVLQNGRPVVGARIGFRSAVTNENQQQNKSDTGIASAVGTTDRKGNFSVSGIGGEPPYNVYIRAPGAPSHFDLADDLDRPLLFTIASGSSISGRIEAADTGDAITRFAYYVSGSCGARGGGQASSPSGKFVIDGLKAGTCTIRFRAEGYAESKIENIELLANEERNDLVIGMQPGASIFGQVQGTKQDKKIYVFAQHYENGKKSRLYSARVETDGSFQFENLPEGNFQLYLQGFSSTTPVTLRAGEAKLDISLIASDE